MSEVRSYLTSAFGSNARVTQLDVNFDRNPIGVRSVVIAPRNRSMPSAKLTAGLQKSLGQPVTLQVDQVLLGTGAGALEAQRAELAEAKDGAVTSAERQRAATAQLVALAAGVEPDDVTIDPDHHRMSARAAALPGADLRTYRALEQRAATSADGWEVTLVPPLEPLPEIRFADNSDVLDEAGRSAVLLSGWAAQRWNLPALGVPGLPSSDTPRAKPVLSQRRGLAVAAFVKAQGVAVTALPAAGQAFRLQTAMSTAAP